MIRAEDKTIECIVCNTMVVLSGYNTTICPACGTSYYELERAILGLKDWIDRLKAEGKNPDDYIDKLAGLARLRELGSQKIVSLSEWRKLKELFQDECDPPSEMPESTP
jgi:hypothetical protein